MLWADEDAARLGAALDDLASPTLFGGPQVLVVRQADTLRDDDQGRVLEALPALGTGGGLILVARTADQRKRLLAACVRAGAAFAFPPVDPRTAQTWVVRLAREQGHDIVPAAAQELVDRSGVELGVLAGEIAKLSLHVGTKKRIELAHVRELVAAVRPRAVEELTDRLARRDLAGALHVLRELLAGGEPPVRAVAFVAANLRRALQVAELAEAKLTADEIAARLGMPPWLVTRSLGRGSARQLARALLVLRRLDLELKNTRPVEAVFEAAIFEIAGGTAVSARPRPAG
jgi:DNA polymerase-3 subunit delta